jgi:Leucine-rich repeat (LRR) protein
MSDAETAYKAAEAEIEHLRTSGGGVLVLSGEAYNALTWIPDSVAQLTALTTLQLGDTQVSDLTPIAQLTALTSLYFANTQVSDLNRQIADAPCTVFDMVADPFQYQNLAETDADAALFQRLKHLDQLYPWSELQDDPK